MKKLRNLCIKLYSYCLGKFNSLKVKILFFIIILFCFLGIGKMGIKICRDYLRVYRKRKVKEDKEKLNGNSFY